MRVQPWLALILLGCGALPAASATDSAHEGSTATSGEEASAPEGPAALGRDTAAPSDRTEPPAASVKQSALAAADDSCGTVTPNLYIRDYRGGPEVVQTRADEVRLSRDGARVSDSLSHAGVEASYTAACAVRSESAGSLLFDVSLTGHARRGCGTGPNGSNGRVAPVWRGRVTLPSGSAYVISTAYDGARSASDGRAMSAPSACRIEVGGDVLGISGSSGSRDFSAAAGTVLLVVNCATDANDGVAATGCYGAGAGPVSPDAVDGNLHVTFSVRRAP